MDARDEDLINRAVVGDEQALGELLRRHGPAVRKSLTGKIDKRWQSVLNEDDVMQETYADAFLSIAQFSAQGPNSFVRWLSRLARNNLLDAVRGLSAARRGGNRVSVSTEPQSESYLNLYEQLGGTTTSPSAAAAMQEAKRALDAAFEEMPESYREVVSLYDLAGCSVADVCEACGCSEGAMFMRRARAHRMLRDLIGGTSF